MYSSDSFWRLNGLTSYGVSFITVTVVVVVVHATVLSSSIEASGSMLIRNRCILHQERATSHQHRHTSYNSNCHHSLRAATHGCCHRRWWKDGGDEGNRRNRRIMVRHHFCVFVVFVVLCLMFVVLCVYDFIMTTKINFVCVDLLDSTKKKRYRFHE